MYAKSFCLYYSLWHIGLRLTDTLSRDNNHTVNLPIFEQTNTIGYGENTKQYWKPLGYRNMER